MDKLKEMTVPEMVDEVQTLILSFSVNDDKEGALKFVRQMVKDLTGKENEIPQDELIDMDEKLFWAHYGFNVGVLMGGVIKQNNEN